VPDATALTRRALLAQTLAAAALAAPAAGAILPREDDAAAGRSPARTPTPGAGYPPLPSGARPFSPGERLRYAVAFEGISAGEAMLAVVGPSAIGPRAGLLVRYTGGTRGVAARVYRLQDRIDALLEPRRLFTHRYESWSVQRNRRRHRVVVFEPEARRFVRTEEGGDTTTGPLEGEAVDSLGLVYHLRVQPLEPGGRIVIPVYRRQEVTAVTFSVTGPETIDTPVGRFATLQVQPVATAPDPRAGRAGAEPTSGDGGLLGGSASMWFTSDARRLPVRLVGTARFGSIDARLADLELPPA
jgi:Protein of unknown function (DUF3108)